MRAVSPAEGRVSVGFPQAWHALSVSIIRLQGGPARLTMTAWHLQQRHEICSFSEALWIEARCLQGITESASWLLRDPNPAAWGVSTADPGLSEEGSLSLKRRNLRCGGRRRVILPDTPPILAGYGDLHSHWLATAVDWFVSFTLVVRVSWTSLLKRAPGWHN